MATNEQTQKDTAKAKSRTFGRSKRAKEEEEEELPVQEEILRNNPMMQPTNLMGQQAPQANNQLTFADRERASGLFGTTRGYSQGNAPASASQLKSAQSNYLREQGNALGGRLTQSQIEKAQRHAGSMGLDFDPNAGYVPKGYGKTPRASSSQRRDSREARSAATGNSITKGGAAGLAAALGRYNTLGEKKLMAKMMFNPGSLTDAEKRQLGFEEIGKYYDNVPSELTAFGDARQSAMGIETMNPSQFRQYEESQRQQDEYDSAQRQYSLANHYNSGGLLSDENKQELTDLGIFSKERYEGMLGRKGYTSDNGQMMYDPYLEQKSANRPAGSITSGLQGLSMPEKNRLSSQGLLGSSMTGNQLGSQMGSLMGTSALNRATGGYFG